MLRGSRIQVALGSKYPNSRVSRSKKPFRVWILGPETLLFGYSDPLGGSFLTDSTLLSPGPTAISSNFLAGDVLRCWSGFNM